MADIFQEVDEEVRREQLKKLWERYGNFIIAACVLVVVGTILYLALGFVFHPVVIRLPAF